MAHASNLPTCHPITAHPGIYTIPAPQPIKSAAYPSRQPKSHNPIPLDPVRNIRTAQSTTNTKTTKKSLAQLLPAKMPCYTAKCQYVVELTHSA